MLHKLFLRFSYLFVFNSATAQNGDPYKGKPLDLRDGITTATLAEVGLDGKVVEDLAGKVVSGEFPNIHSLLIYKNNRLVFERYFSGKDQRWGEDRGMVNIPTRLCTT